MDAIRELLTQYVQNHLFDFSSLFSEKQTKDQLISVLDEVLICLDGGMNIKQIMLVITSIVDQELKDLQVERDYIVKIKQAIEDFEEQKQEDIIYAKQILNKIFLQEEIT